MSKSSVPGPQLHATWGCVILVPAPEPGCQPQGRAAGGRAGWLEGVTQPPGSRVAAASPLQPGMVLHEAVLGGGC